MPPLLHVRSWRLSTTADRERRSTASARYVDPAAREDSPQIKQVQLTPQGLCAHRERRHRLVTVAARAF
jgi:hypothetical protein